MIVSNDAYAIARGIGSQLADAPRRLIIDVRVVPALSGESFATINPAAGEEIAQVGRAKDTQLVAGVRHPAGQCKSFSFEPTIFAGAMPSMRAVRDEVFGPVLSAPVRSGSTASTRSAARRARGHGRQAMELYSEIKSVWINLS